MIVKWPIDYSTRTCGRGETYSLVVSGHIRLMSFAILSYRFLAPTL
jgi:hypothetical protein